MKLTKQQLKRLIKEEMEYAQSGLLAEAGELKMRDSVRSAYDAAKALEERVLNLAHPKKLKGPLPTQRSGDPIGFKHTSGGIGGLVGQVKDYAKATELTIFRIANMIENLIGRGTEKATAERKAMGFPFEE